MLKKPKIKKIINRPFRVTQLGKMTKEEFKEKFKVGNIVTRPEWGENKSKIVYIGKEEFACDDTGLNKGIEDGVDSYYFTSGGWQHYKEPVKKDLEGLEKYYVVSSIGVVNIFGWRKERPEAEGFEYLTEEEAIERGLNI
jgi:hypothetical protein